MYEYQYNRAHVTSNRSGRDIYTHLMDYFSKGVIMRVI